MSEKHYKWEIGGPLPILEHHSRVKHEILSAYLSAYVQTLLLGPTRDEFRLTLVDGFSGGGIYQLADTGEEMPGSPMVILDAMREAEALANLERTRRIHFNVDYFFIEEHRKAASFLEHTLKERGFGPQLGQTINVWCDDFNNRADGLIAHVNQRMPRMGRAIFLLDQYGYKDVPADLIRRIMRQIPGSEVILTFNVASLLTYLSDKNGQAQKLLSSASTPDALRGRSIEDIKLNEADWRLFIQACLYPELVERCGAPFYTLFFIRSEQGHGDYWFVHFSKHARARDVMTRIHWEKGNFFVHYGGAGLNMFEGVGYAPSLDSRVTNQGMLGFGFGDLEREASVNTLMDQIPSVVYSAPGEAVVFDEMFATHCNLSPAHAGLHREAISKLRDGGDLEVVSGSTGRTTAAKIQGGDIIRAPAQRKIVF